jgi:hypothetical protein
MQRLCFLLVSCGFVDVEHLASTSYKKIFFFDVVVEIKKPSTNQQELPFNAASLHNAVAMLCFINHTALTLNQIRDVLLSFIR